MMLVCSLQCLENPTIEKCSFQTLPNLSGHCSDIGVGRGSELFRVSHGLKQHRSVVGNHKQCTSHVKPYSAHSPSSAAWASPPSLRAVAA